MIVAVAMLVLQGQNFCTQFFDSSSSNRKQTRVLPSKLPKIDLLPATKQATLHAMRINCLVLHNANIKIME